MLSPPLIITEEETMELVRMFGESIDAFEAEMESEGLL